VYGYTETGSFGVVGVNVSSTAAAGVYGFANGAAGVGVQAQGNRAPIYLVPAGAAGPPSANLHNKGDVWVDSLGVVWVCTTTGTPGTFTPLQPGGFGKAFFQAVSTSQYHLTNSDGATWADIDSTSGTPLVLNISPGFGATALIGGSADLFTGKAGLNQDIGIFVSGGAFGAGSIVGWKESGGFAGTFSPNAAYVEAAVALAASTAYVIKLQWKTNKASGGGTIYAGAGPISSNFSPTRLRVQLIAT
jgi:hypothetical protein